MPKRNRLLVDAGFRNRYPLLGPKKIASHHRPNGCGDESDS